MPGRASVVGNRSSMKISPWINICSILFINRNWSIWKTCVSKKVGGSLCSRARKWSCLSLSLGKWVWCLQIDFQCLNNDGNLFDSCLLALNVALRETMLPTVQIDLDTQKPQVYTKQLLPLKYSQSQEPLCCTIAIYEYDQDLKYLIDPTLEEETVAKSLLHYVLLKNDQLCLLHKTGGTPCSLEKFQQCYSLARDYIIQLRRKLNQWSDWQWMIELFSSVSFSFFNPCLFLSLSLLWLSLLL